jgi:hypothetical protein
MYMRERELLVGQTQAFAGDAQLLFGRIDIEKLRPDLCCDLLTELSAARTRVTAAW